MKWVIEKGPFEEVDYKFEKYCDVTYVKYRPFDIHHPYEFISNDADDLKSVPSPEDKGVIFYGSINLGQQLLNQRYGWQNWLPKDVFDCSYWMSRFKDYTFNNFYDSALVPFGCLLQYLADNNNNTLFIRPNTGYKLFTGHTIYVGPNISAEIKLIENTYQVNPDDLILVSESYKIESEYRFVICQPFDKPFISSGSRYKKDGDLSPSHLIPDECMTFVNKILMECDRINYCPAPAWTLDIAFTEENYYIMEVGSFTSAGLYECDIEKIVTDVEKIVTEYL